MTKQFKPNKSDITVSIGFMSLAASLVSIFLLTQHLNLTWPASLLKCLEEGKCICGIWLFQFFLTHRHAVVLPRGLLLIVILQEIHRVQSCCMILIFTDKHVAHWLFLLDDAQPQLHEHDRRSQVKYICFPSSAVSLLQPFDSLADLLTTSHARYSTEE